ncbi:radical SAM/SPASM domain-containing protein [Thalassospiraceae bacterium LMO-SO8]|nr:SPASM domain-containing protein [Alphaproteobacteria bacterium LMO-S08]WND77648.1 radical SAM/SPASM domain-containing protein [Thalassospiraceae bacterium LMO-SO8]
MEHTLENPVSADSTKLPAHNERILNEFVGRFGLRSIEDFHFFPKQISIEPTSSCNARCYMCPVEEWERDHLLMPQLIFDKILEDLKPYASWLERVTLPIIGEPLIDKKLEDKIQALKGIGIKLVDLTSNASLMTRARAASLINAGLDAIDYSIDGATKETFEAIRKRLNFEKCVENIESFIEVRNELKPDLRIRVRMTVTEANIGELQAFKDFWSKRLGPQDVVYGKLLHNWGNWDDRLMAPETLEDETLNTLTCISPWIILNIFTDGRVPLCCVDFNAESELGNVMTASIADIWRNEKSRSVREAHGQLGRNSLKPCVGCYAWEQTLKV